MRHISHRHRTQFLIGQQSGGASEESTRFRGSFCALLHLAPYALT